MLSRTAILRGPEAIELAEVEIDLAASPHLVLRTLLAGIDGTEIARYFGNLPASYFHKLGGRACVMGDEILGEVISIPAGSANWSHLGVGDRVVLEPKHACNACKYCLSGHDIHCEQQRGFGVIPFEESPGLWGGFSELVCVPAGAKVHKVPEGVSDERALLSAVVLADGVRWAQDKGQVKPGDDVLVIGPGPQGLAAVAGAAWAGASRIIIAGRGQDASRMKLAVALGATDVIDVDAASLPAAVAALTDDGLIDVVIDCGSRQCQVASLVPLLRKLGRFVVISVGVQSTEVFPTALIQKGEITVVGGRGPRSTTVVTALSRVVSSSAPVERIITHRFPLERVSEALSVAGRRIASDTDCIKAIIDFRMAGAHHV